MTEMDPREQPALDNVGGDVDDLVGEEVEPEHDLDISTFEDEEDDL